MDLLNDPALQGGATPLLVALIVAMALTRTRFAWLAIVAAYASMIALDGQFALSPMTAARKVVLIGVGSALFGLSVDWLRPPPRYLTQVLALAAGLVSAWVFISVLRQREAVHGVALGMGVAAFVTVMVIATLRLRDDGLRMGAAGVGLGLACGIAGVISASIGYLLAGTALAAASGALLLVQVMTGRMLVPGFTGALPIGVLAAFFAGATLLLAQLPWYALPLLLLVPIAAKLPVSAGPMITRAAVLGGYTLAAASLPIAAAWYAARHS
jgi:hypothetical protein